MYWLKQEATQRSMGTLPIRFSFQETNIFGNFVMSQQLKNKFIRSNYIFMQIVNKT